MYLCRSLEEFDFIFHNLFILLLSKNKEKFDNSLKVIAIISQNQLNENDDIVKEINNFSDDCNEIDVDYDSIKNFMYSKSLFYEKYNKIISILEVDLEQSKEIDKVSNKMFFLEFLNHILTVWIPYLPLWTAIDLDLINPKISRLTNAYIKATHKVNKDFVVQNTRNTSLGDVVRLLENR